MSEAVVVALIAGGVSLLGTVISVFVANHATLSALEKKSEISDEKIQGEINVIKSEITTLSDRVEAHNRVVERTYRLEGAVSELQHNVRDLKGAKT